MSERTEGISVTLPAQDLEQVRQIVKAGGARSVSSYLAEALHNQLTRQQRAEHAMALTRDLFGGPADLSPHEQAQVEKQISRIKEAARVHASKATSAGEVA